MMQLTQREHFEAVIFESVAEMNELNTEEVLIMTIAREIQQRSRLNKAFAAAGMEAYTIPALQDEQLTVDNGVYLYCKDSLLDWSYDRFDTIADAIRQAVYMFNAYIICDGKIVKYDALDDETAYYYDGDAMRLVKLGE